ncbi:MAG: GNAT family N-acetyltransferase [Bacteroidales bacterium]|nr:GNAT family N-acetyltransferase [Bacteroidales bacterium]
MKMIFRDFSPGDFEQVNTLWSHIGLGGVHRGDTQEVICRTLDHDGRLLLMIHPDTEEIIGTAWLTVDYRRTYLHHFGIAKAWQGQKLSNQLLEETLIIARKIGYQLKLEVHVTNLAAVHLYKKYGFQYLGEYDVYIVRDVQSV